MAARVREAVGFAISGSGLVVMLSQLALAYAG
jgi:hypothetical protein